MVGQTFFPRLGVKSQQIVVLLPVLEIDAFSSLAIDSCSHTKARKDWLVDPEC